TLCIYKLHIILRCFGTAKMQAGTSRPAMSAFQRDTFDLCLRRLGSGQGHGQHTVAERGLDGPFVNAGGQRDAPLEPPIDTLAEAAFAILGRGGLFTPQGQQPVLQQNLHVLFFKAGKLGSDRDRLVRLGDLDAGPVCPHPAIATREDRRWGAERPEKIVKQPIYLAVEGCERITNRLCRRGVITTPPRQISGPVLRNKISYAHFSVSCFCTWPAQGWH